ncbi:amidohydrolase [Paenibacillus agilis]|uniref:Amidohydrolase family protein n=1 Tax=Paenibacillus agilis TaxID=3020863 RepID=A0A559IY01_9BACL|nr:amidohydrolase [Paenibacillus agilis]TVX92510.1 amidohydrolase family protein [Paenibacillus agilis]
MNAYWITNVRLDSGFQEDEDGVFHTLSELVHLFIENGVIQQIVLADRQLETELQKHDAHGKLALPSFQENHNHLDKTYLGYGWKSCKPVKNLIERLDMEAKESILLLDSIQTRAEAMLELISSFGATHIRTHVNIDPHVGLKNLEGVRRALDTYSDRMTAEIVAFPQHGLLRSDAGELMRQAMREGATHVGGLDPGGVDGDIEKSLGLMMDIAVEANADVDIHLHDSSTLGLHTMKRIADLTEEAGWHNRMAISHAFALGDAPQVQVNDIIDRFAALGVSIMTTVASSRPIPVPQMHEKGITVALGCDGFYDSWAPFGTGDVLEKATLLAERYRWIDERSLTGALTFITGGRKTLDEQGNRLWPQVGDQADMIFFDATCSAEVVARRPARKAVMFQGNVIRGTL